MIHLLPAWLSQSPLGLGGPVGDQEVGLEFQIAWASGDIGPK